VRDDTRLFEGRANADRHGAAAHTDELGTAEPRRENIIIAKQLPEGLSDGTKFVLARLSRRRFRATVVFALRELDRLPR